MFVWNKYRDTLFGFLCPVCPAVELKGLNACTYVVSAVLYNWNDRIIPGTEHRDVQRSTHQQMELTPMFWTIEKAYSEETPITRVPVNSLYVIVAPTETFFVC